ncbi:MAG TPA: FtsX-like permease family protein, partial [Acidimicrobiia bacterium]|nr:FtsX-like permease family protein [Acidimicrobiia bacterium]
YVIILKPKDVSTDAAQRVVNHVASQFGGINAQNKAEFKSSQLNQFNQILGLVYVLLLFAVIIALVGIVNTLALSIYERTREIGLLRAVGMTRAQLRRMVRGEAVIVAVFGSLLGLVVGIGFGLAIVRSLHRQSIFLTVPVGQLVAFVVLAAIAGLLAGWLPARRAARLDVLQAINEA